MGARGESLARRFEEISAEFITLIEGCDDDAWGAICPDVGWPLGTTALHVALGIRFEEDVAKRVATGREPRPETMADIDAGNAQRAIKELPDRQDVLNRLRRYQARAATTIRSLTDDQLDRSAPVPLFDNRVTTAQQVIEWLLIGHIEGHIGGVRAALSNKAQS